MQHTILLLRLCQSGKERFVEKSNIGFVKLRYLLISMGIHAITLAAS